MNTEEKIDKILELQGKMHTDLALIKQRHEEHMEDYKEVKASHYKLRDEFGGLKGKVILISGAIGAFFTLIGNWIYKVFSGHS